MLKNLLILAIGVTIGWLVTKLYWSTDIKQQRANPLDSHQTTEAPVLAHPNSFSETKSSFEQPVLNKQSTQANDCPEVSSKGEPDDGLLVKLIRTRAILVDELSIMKHWSSIEDLENYLNQFDLNQTERFRILAKAYMYFREDFLAALQELYAARASADANTLKIIDNEIAILVDYVDTMFFKNSDKVSNDLFYTFMLLVNEKQPTYLPAIKALVRNYALTGEYSMANSLIDSIPSDYELQAVKEHLREDVKRAAEDAGPFAGGIPLAKEGNQFIVRATLNNTVSLNLILDTGASKSLLSRSALLGIHRLTDELTSVGFRYINTANGTARANIYQAKSLTVGNFDLIRPLILSSNMSSNKRVHGLLGMDFLGKFQFRIDHEKHLLYLSR